MKKNDWTWAIILLSMAATIFGACNKDVRYTELEQASVDSLRQTRIPGVFVVGGRWAQPRPARDPALMCPTHCAFTRIYWAQVSYPITICNPPDFDLEMKNYTRKSRTPDSLDVLLRAKLPYTSQVSKRSLPWPWFEKLFCRTHGGPWIAEIREEQQCVSCGPGRLKYSMVILGVPDELWWEWWDSMDNHPQEVSFIESPFLRSEWIVDCDPFDLTKCGN